MNYLLKVCYVVLILICSYQVDGQTYTQDQDDATFGIDRKNWNEDSFAIHSQGYMHDFTLPSMNSSCEKITGVSVNINVTNYIDNTPISCFPSELYLNLFYGCTPYSGPISCEESNVIGEQPVAVGAGNYNFNFGCPLTPTSPEADFEGNLSIDLVPLLNPGCDPNWQNSLGEGFLEYEYIVTVTVTVEDITCNGTGCLAPNVVMIACDDGDNCTEGEMKGVLSCDSNQECIPCGGGTPVSDPGTCINDNDCNNGIETWNPATCVCEQLNIPDPSSCINDNNCSNGVETVSTIIIVAMV